jgi:hypothetical protein
MGDLRFTPPDFFAVRFLAIGFFLTAGRLADDFRDAVFFAPRFAAFFAPPFLAGERLLLDLRRELFLAAMNGSCFS